VYNFPYLLPLRGRIKVGVKKKRGVNDA